MGEGVTVARGNVLAGAVTADVATAPGAPLPASMGVGTTRDGVPSGGEGVTVALGDELVGATVTTTSTLVLLVAKQSRCPTRIELALEILFVRIIELTVVP